ncbi:MAG: MlaD family protein [Planctomycetota bacterium]
MSRKAKPARIGAFVVGAIVLALAAVLTFGSGDLFRETLPCVSFFEDDINGLSAGAPVKFKGVEIGQVNEIRLPLDKTMAASVIQVTYELSTRQLSGLEHGEATPERLKQAVREGLHVRLATESFVTGVLYLSLEIQPEGPRKLVGALQGVTEIPALPSRTREIQNLAEKAVARFSELPLEDVAVAARDALRAIDDVLRSPGVERTLASAEKTLGSADRAFASIEALSESLQPELVRLVESLDTTLAAARASFAKLELTLETGERTIEEVARDLRANVEVLSSTLKDTADATQATAQRLQATLLTAETLLDPKAPLAESLQHTLTELGRAARLLAQFADALQRDPSLLLRGRDVQESAR